MTYNTGNAIGSQDPRDLFDNAENLDKAVNDRGGLTWKDRMGNSRPTLHAVESAGATVLAARDDAVLARDAAIAAAGPLYATEAEGRAAVADGETFKVQGAGDVAAYEYRRVDSATSVPIASYPSMQAVRAPITPERTTFVVPGKNKFNAATAAIGSHMPPDGVLRANSDYDCSDFIAVKPGEVFTSSHPMRYTCYFDANKSVVAGGSPDPISAFTVPAGVAFVRITIIVTHLPIFQLELGAVSTAYEAYKLHIDTLINITSQSIPPKSIGAPQLSAQAVTPNETNFIQLGKNKFYEATAVIGEYLTPTGTVGPNASYAYSDFIAVKPGEVFTSSHSMRYTCYFDANKSVVAGGSPDPSIAFTVPTGVAFVRITIIVTHLPIFQLELGAVSTAYEAYAYTLGLLNGAPILVPDAGGSNLAPSIVVPPAIYAVQGRECNVYIDNLHYSDSSEWLHDFTTTYGAQMRDRWTYTPTAAAGTTITYSAHDKRTGGGLASASTVLRGAAANAGSGTSKKVLVIGDSWVNAGVITQTLLDNAAADVMGITLYGTRGAGANKHEGRGGWTVNDYSTAGRTYRRFFVSGVTQVPSINATTYSDGAGSVYLVQEAVSTGAGSWTLDCSVSSGPSTPPASGVLTKTNGSAGDATLNFSATSAVPANPFWIGGAINFAQYLTNNSIPVLDWVTIGLGVNDCFGQTSDAACAALADAEFAKLDTLIASIKASGAGTKVALLLPGPGANQDAFAANYFAGQTAWRYKRNVMIWSARLIAKYAGQEANRVYIVPTNTALDTANNMPVDAGTPINSRNPALVVRQNNGVHPAPIGYQQIGDALWAFLKFYA